MIYIQKFLKGKFEFGLHLYVFSFFIIGLLIHKNFASLMMSPFKEVLAIIGIFQ